MSIPPAVVTAGVWVWLMVRVPLGESDQARWARQFGIKLFVLIVIVTLATIAVGEINTRAERAMARGVAHRISRAEAVPLRVILGPVRSAYLAATLVLQAAIAVAVPFASAGWVGWAYPVAFVVVAAMVMLAITRATARMTVALDLTSLAIDERLRAQDVFGSISSLHMLLFAFSFAVITSPNPASWLLPLWVGSCVVIFGLFLWAQMSAPWHHQAKNWPRTTPVPGAVTR